MEVLRVAAAFLNWGLKGLAMRFAGVWPLVGVRATHMVPEARWAVNRLAVLPLWYSRPGTIASPREFDPALTSHCTHHRTSNLPTDGANCRVSVFRLGPLQWICKEWVQKLGSDEATAYFGGEKYTESSSPTSQGERTPRLRMWTPNSSRIPGASLLSLGFLFLPPPPPLWEISVVIYPSLPFILLLHLLVIHTYTWVHIPSATLSSTLWATVAPITLSKGCVHVNGVRVLVVGIWYGGDSFSGGCFFYHAPMAGP